MQSQQLSTTRPAAAGIPVRRRVDIALICRLVPVATWSLTAALVAAGAIGIAAAPRGSWWLTAAAVLLVPVVVVGLASAIRIGGELALALQCMSRDVTGIAERLPQLGDTVDDLDRQIPRRLPQLIDTLDDLASQVPGLGILRKRSSR